MDLRFINLCGYLEFKFEEAIHSLILQSLDICESEQDLDVPMFIQMNIQSASTKAINTVERIAYYYIIHCHLLEAYVFSSYATHNMGNIPSTFEALFYLNFKLFELFYC